MIEVRCSHCLAGRLQDIAAGETHVVWCDGCGALSVPAFPGWPFIPRGALTAQVSEFHVAFQPHMNVPPPPKVPEDKMVRLRLKLIFEEAFEGATACLDIENKSLSADAHVEGVGTWRGNLENARVAVERLIDEVPIRVNMIEWADALGDLDFVVEGSRLAFGIDGRPVAAEIHRSNMSKVGGSRAPSGKWIKPESYSPADIAGVLRIQGWRG